VRLIGGSGYGRDRRDRSRRALSYTAPIAEDDRRQYKKVARARAEEQTREALLDSAVEEFYSDRWSKSSLDAIAGKAGVTKQTLLRHFGSREGLLLQALVRSASQVLDQRWSTPVGDIQGAVENLLDHYESWGQRSLRIGAWDRGPAALAKLSDVARKVHYDWVEHAFAPWLDHLQGDARSRRRAQLIAICDVHTWWLLSHDLGHERSEVREILVDLIGRVIAEKT
jgi:AcrR family transcriptional regulator